MSKFKQGDRVQNKDTGDYGIIISTDGDTAIVNYGWDEGHLSIGFKDLVLNEPPTSIDPTTAFLTELQALMRKYDVKEIGLNSISDIWSCYYITIGDKKIKYETESLTPDNIFDYEK